MDPAPIAAYTLSPELAARADTYQRLSREIYGFDVLWTVLMLVLLIQLRVAPRLQRLAERVSPKHFWQACVFAPLLGLLVALLGLPAPVWGELMERRFGLSTQSWSSFARDFAVTQLLIIGLGTLLVWLLYLVLRRSPRRWWLWAWAAMMPVLLFVLFLEPFVVEPLFFKFSPLVDRDPALAARLHDIAARGGEAIPTTRMFVMDASEKTNGVNAYVTGFGASKRVVVWDTTLAALHEDELSSVFGHELGHYVLGHVFMLILFNGAGLLLLFWLSARASGFLIPRWGVPRLDQLGSLPILMLVAFGLSTLATPVSAQFSRFCEHQADAFGLSVIRGTIGDPPQATARALQRMGEIDLEPLDPSPPVVFWFYDHPPVRDRVRFALTTEAGGRDAKSAAAPLPPPR